MFSPGTFNLLLSKPRLNLALPLAGCVDVNKLSTLYDLKFSISRKKMMPLTLYFAVRIKGEFP